ncbi:hypothetical protein GPECTOR_51g720 [Gonium pectorale]|uniref:Carboxylic ester hydrolase n=1 Tax=Gonium pectorale TaxID=33097 RepID=A0A150G7B7_GONPE|nr:hypothetical protein GPECTOR_51g720 [Gonium pectorale]|eukprot:KXZ45734.1 hypothetical protein GPECTOR_51g720 [Gonium pectorale]
MCMQPDAENTSEDCLFLNIWTPTTNTSARLPVRVFIHGGAYYTGSGSDIYHGGCQIANDSNVVAVTINYRLGVLGFLALPGLEDSTAGGTTGTWGLLDQRMALRWIQDNIRAFGGDPAKVMITGESAGAFSVLLHTMMPGGQATGSSKSLFYAAAPVSGSLDVFSVDFLKDAYNKGRVVAEAVGCAATLTMAQRRDCLLRAPASKIISAQSAVQPYAHVLPAIDGKQLPKHPLRLMQEGAMNKVPMLFGLMKNEGIQFAVDHTGGNFAINQTEMLAALKKEVFVPSAFVTRLYSQYNDQYYGSWFAALTVAITEGTFWCPTYRAARQFARHSSSLTRLYIMSAARPMSGCIYNAIFGQEAGGLAEAELADAFHSYDIPVSFMVPHLAPGACGWTEPEFELSSFLSGILSNFAANRTPLPPRSTSLNRTLVRGVSWPAWSSTNQQVLMLDWGKPSFEPANTLLGSACKLWDDILEYNIKRGSNY